MSSPSAPPMMVASWPTSTPPHHECSWSSKGNVSDQGTKFTSRFWKKSQEAMGTKLSFSTAFHPQSDGQTELTNQNLKQYLRCFSNAKQDDWSIHLPLAQYSYNSAKHSSTGMTPLMANLGYTPNFFPKPSGSFQPSSSSEFLT